MYRFKANIETSELTQSELLEIISEALFDHVDSFEVTVEEDN